MTRSASSDWRTPTLDTFDTDYLTETEQRLADSEPPKRKSRNGYEPKPEPKVIRLADVKR